MHVRVVGEYKAIADTMIAEYRLVATSSDLIAAYNTRVQSNDSLTMTADSNVSRAKGEINSLTRHLDSAIVDQQSLASYQGLKNSIATLTTTIYGSLDRLATQNIKDYTTDYKLANKQYEFVRENGTTLVFNELRYMSSVQAGINRTYTYSLVAGIIAFVSVLAACILYAVRFARRITLPIVTLTSLAQQIAGGDMKIAMNPSLLARHDETGSLSRSFGLMVTNLKEKIDEVNNAKAGVEKKVEERTSELTEEKSRLTASINSLSLGFIMTDNHNNLFAINDAAKAVLSYHLTKEGVSEPAPIEAEHEWTTEELNAKFTGDFKLNDTLLQSLHNGQPVERKEVEYNGRILRIFVAPIMNSAPQAEDKILGSVVLLEDITEEKVQERSRDEFFSIASHELRTPLTAIRGNASIIMQMYKKLLEDKDLHEMVFDIHESSTRLIDIVNDFLDTSRLEQGKAKFNNSEVALDRVIENVVYEMRAVLNEKHLTLQYDHMTLDKLPKIWADPDRVKQVLYNLVGNAAKFTEKGGIAIAAASIGNMMKVTVTDTGRGISPEGQQILFHKFQQAGSSLLTRDTTRGTGLGLYISKMLVENMGGQITLESSNEGKGSVFSFVLPLAQGQKTGDATAPHTDTKTGLAIDPITKAANILSKPAGTPATSSSPSRLLIIEDDPYVVRFYQRLFNEPPINVQTLSDSTIALKTAQEFQPHLILLDIMMPKMNGLEVLAVLKADPKTKHIPIFILSNLGEENTVHTALEAGADAYLIKSNYAPEQIRDKVREQLQKHDSEY